MGEIVVCFVDERAIHEAQHKGRYDLSHGMTTSSEQAVGSTSHRLKMSGTAELQTVAP